MERAVGILTKYFREGVSRYQNRWQYVNDCTLVTPYRLSRGGVNDVSLSAQCTERKTYMAFTVYPMMRGPRVSVGAWPLAPDIGDKRLAIWWNHSRGHRLPAVARREAKGRSFDVDPVARGYEALNKQERFSPPVEIFCCSLLSSPDTAISVGCLGRHFREVHHWSTVYQILGRLFNLLGLVDPAIAVWGAAMAAPESRMPGLVARVLRLALFVPHVHSCLVLDSFLATSGALRG